MYFQLIVVVCDLGFSNVLGSIRVKNVGPLLMALALLLFLVSIKQLLMARKQRTQHRRDEEVYLL